MQGYAVTAGELEEECIKVFKVTAKNILDVIVCFAEINQDVTLVFTPRKLLGNVTLANTANAIYQQSATPSIQTLPFKKPVIDFPSHAQIFLSLLRWRLL